MTLRAFCPSMFGTIGCEKPPGHSDEHKNGRAYWADKEDTNGPDLRAKKDMISSINTTNFQDVAQTAIREYFKKGMLLDALLWGSIIAYYDAALKK